MNLWTVVGFGCGPAVSERPPEIAPAAARIDAEALYLACRDRVEGAESAGECVGDGGCATSGCSGEVCAAVDERSQTACVVEPCFAVLDRCRCTGGRCQWVLRAGAP